MRIGAITHIRIGGAIDETFSSAAILGDAAGHVLIDLGTLERISSFGVRNWIECVSKLPANVASLSIIHAPPIIVDQFNMVEGFSGIAQLLSVLAPYHCGTCQESRTRLIDIDAHREVIAAEGVPEQRCRACNSVLEFTEMPGEYFDFMRTQRASTSDSMVQRYLRTLYLTDVADQGSQLKLVQDDLTYLRIGGKVGAELNVRRLSAGLEGRVIFDLGAITELEPAGLLKLLEILSKASAGATVVLWRAPLQVLSAIAASRKPIPVTVGSAWLNLSCASCGFSVGDRVAGTAAELAGAAPVRQCHVCGGEAHVSEGEWKTLLAALPAEPMDATTFEIVDQLERRALSHYLSGGTNPDHVPGNPAADTSSNKFQIIRRLGQGGMAEVFLARQVGVKGFEKYVVVKRILNQFAESPDFVEMLFAEARANARLTHPNIVQTYDAGMMEGNVAYIAMEYVRGPDVKRLIVELRKRGIRMPIEHVLRIVAETASGLHYAHSYVDPTGKPHPMVHRDVSPHNVLLSLDGAIKLSDFGIAKVQGEEHTQAGVLKGKIAYISPEAISGLPLDARNDVFALGVMLYEMLLGQLPFRRENDAATLRAILREAPKAPHEVDPNIPQDISNLVLWALEKDVNRRIPTAARLRDEIEAAMVRHHLSSSSAAVAIFVKEALGEVLASYGPVSAASGATGVTPSRTGIPALGAPAPSFNAAARPPPPVAAQPAPAPVSAALQAAANGQSVVIELSEIDQVAPGAEEDPDDTATSFTPPPPGVRVAAAEASEAPRPHAGARTTSPEIKLPAGAGASSDAPTDPPTPAASRPVATKPSPAPKNAAPSPSPAPQKSAAPAPKPVVSKPAPPAPAPRSAPAPTPVAAETAPVPAPQGARKWAGLAAGAAAVLLAVGLGVTALNLGGDKDLTQVLNLEANEKLYVGGLRVEPTSLRLPDDVPSFVSVSSNGKLERFGTASGKYLDARALLSARAAEGDKSKLYIESSPPGCIVKLAGEQQPAVTPTETVIAAGQELEVQLTCSNGKSWSGWVMGLPRQEIKVAPNLMQ